MGRFNFVDVYSVGDIDVFVYCLLCGIFLLCFGVFLFGFYLRVGFLVYILNKLEGYFFLFLIFRVVLRCSANLVFLVGI